MAKFQGNFDAIRRPESQFQTMPRVVRDEPTNVRESDQHCHICERPLFADRIKCANVDPIADEVIAVVCICVPCDNLDLSRSY